MLWIRAAIILVGRQIVLFAEGDESPLDYMFERVIAGSGKDCTVDDYAYDEARGYVEMYSTDCDGSTQGGRYVACFEAGTLDESRCDVEPSW